ncbi:hypothetical protein [Streptomyces purpurogeneiscleroticus]|uniref:hypothetical protein n=1 Tax=Streptomyces purpurogeneiscleroticus TaxID=68259 RepID=UPI001CBFD5C8|nr:hypothetical protein [Streptomyces purpurogeneiscleroticus]MBZ4017820.1 hypothetical protein [Streptomyces purpurogeneiscleroticus]
MRYPDAQLRANHRPADLIPASVHPGEVVVIQAPPRSYAGPILLTITIAIGASVVLIVLAVTFQIAAAAAAAAVPTVGGAGVSLKLARKR